MHAVPHGQLSGLHPKEPIFIPPHFLELIVLLQRIAACCDEQQYLVPFLLLYIPEAMGRLDFIEHQVGIKAITGSPCTEVLYQYVEAEQHRFFVLHLFFVERLFQRCRFHQFERMGWEKIDLADLAGRMSASSCSL